MKMTVLPVLLALWGLAGCGESAPSDASQCPSQQACSTPLENRCMGQQVQVCRDFAGCQQWVLVRQCSAQQQCVAGACHGSEDVTFDPEVVLPSDATEGPKVDLIVPPGDLSDAALPEYVPDDGDLLHEVNNHETQVWPEIWYEELHEDPEPEVVDPDVFSCAAICGDAECGTVQQCLCGVCSGGEHCSGLQCVCTPKCQGKECGMDGCGGYCGSCPIGESCGADYVCHSNDCAPPEFGAQVAKLVSLSFGNGGLPGQAMDVDHNPATCAPVENCQDGLDNGLSEFVGVTKDFSDANQTLVKSLESGETVWMVELLEPTTDGQNFQVNLYRGTPVLPKSECDFQASECHYLALPESFQFFPCGAMTQLTSSFIWEGKLYAGGGNDDLLMRVLVDNMFDQVEDSFLYVMLR